MIEITWDVVIAWYKTGLTVLLVALAMAYLGSILYLLYLNAKNFALYEEYIPKEQDWSFSDLGVMTMVCIIGGCIGCFLWPLTITVVFFVGSFKLFVKYMHWKYGKERMMMKLKGEEQGNTDA